MVKEALLTRNGHHSEWDSEYLCLGSWPLCTNSQLVTVLDQSSAPCGGSTSWDLFTVQHCGGGGGNSTSTVGLVRFNV